MDRNVSSLDCSNLDCAIASNFARSMRVKFQAAGGFEPPHRSFADCSLTTWVRRRLTDEP